MKTRAAIFDLDGTVLNTLPDLADSLNIALEAAGYPARTLDEYRFMVGNGMAKMIERALPDDRKTPEIQTEIMKHFKNEYALRQCDKTAPYEGITDLLQDLKARGWKLGLLSNKDHENTLEIVNHFFSGIFDVIIGVKPGGPSKPDPAGALEICRTLGFKPQEVIYLGDSGVDMATANAAGCPALGAGWGFRPAEELQEGGAKAILEKPTDFLAKAESL
ncbi:MAG: HAD family hydrolase [Deltaproteobacteria bacterium]|jgi:phosphoglycolate phosphatase|nr:HAD family hydrolase [Deltaproteobacteria bacterium]